MRLRLICQLASGSRNRLALRMTRTIPTRGAIVAMTDQPHSRRVLAPASVRCRSRHGDDSALVQGGLLVVRLALTGQVKPLTSAS
jgi:hypothetical protein